MLSTWKKKLKKAFNRVFRKQKLLFGVHFLQKIWSVVKNYLNYLMLVQIYEILQKTTPILLSLSRLNKKYPQQSYFSL